MNVVTTMTKTNDDQTFTWRFCETPEGFCAVGGNYKLISYRSQAAMDRSIKWFESKGFVIAA